jgi:hypothetical protein
MRLRTPVRFMFASALFTHAINGLPFWNTIPKRYFVPLLSNWPITFEFGTCAAVT